MIDAFASGESKENAKFEIILFMSRNLTCGAQFTFLKKRTGCELKNSRRSLAYAIEFVL